jgi:hypothetical protein
MVFAKKERPGYISFQVIPLYTMNYFSVLCRVDIKQNYKKKYSTITILMGYKYNKISTFYP